MSTTHLTVRFENITVRFIDHPPSEELVCFARRCAKERWLSGPLTVAVRVKAGAPQPDYEVQVARPGEPGVSRDGADVLAVMRHAFDRFEMALPSAVH